ncbi:ATP-binding protein [Alkalicoccobacillus plakortidis]|uniref:histidine kinase n=1 Tax=Alkalicoccobacillus plakortidis TaxID=444060 RepID=A0ABT0XE71_9BACI|nr:ATP-binding protein [Alkalicoccobacillus plakortidis]MCM2674191.1 ATP-binding protein [Alkalicoccobacillus plakortidis]
MKEYFQKSLNRQLVSFMAIIIFVTLILGTGLIYYVSANQTSYIDNRQELVEKQDLAFQIDTKVNQMLIHLRGYFAFQSDKEYSLLISDLESISQSIDEFSYMNLESEEVEFIDAVDILIEQVESFIPTAVELINNENLEELREIGNSSGGEVVNQLTALTTENLKQTNDKLANLSSDYTKANNTVLWLLFGFIVIFIAALFLIIRRIFTKIGKPLGDLTLASQQLAAGKDVNLIESNREDEVGILSRTFNGMVYTLQEKEEELIAQNEELISQQEELEHQQFKLRSSLEETESVRQVLEKYNRLNHSISVTLNEQELLEQIIDHMGELYPVERMGFVLLKGSKRVAVRGISDNLMKVLSETFHDGMGVLLNEKKTCHQVKRKSSKYEQGIAEEPIDVYDLYVPVYSSSKDLTAVFCATRVGTSFSGKEQKELQGVMGHIAIAVERVMLYEQTEQDRQLNQDIIDNVNEGIQFMDREGMLLRSNELFREMVNLPQDGFELEYKQYDSWKHQWLDHVEEADKLASFLDQVLLAETDEILSMKYKLIEGSRMIEVYAEPVYQDEVRKGTILVHRDITKEHEVDQMKSELVSTVSHELRTPLSSILGFTELMIERELKQARQEKYLKTIHKEANRLTNLINDFLDLQRMESNVQTYNKNSVDLKELLVQVIAKYEPTYKDHQFMIRDLANQTVVWADADRMEQVFINIISNAVKFSPNGGHVEVVLLNKVDSLYIHINDEGLGIPEAELGKMFTKFHRIDNSDRRKIGGTGLGLPITKEILEAHGGSISVKSELGVGSTFILALPYEIQSSLLPISTINADDMNRFRVAIIEDDQSLALLLAEELKQSGFEVQHFLNPQKALDQIKTQQIDAVVVDLMLGDEMDGWEFIKALKQSDETKNLPVFISSALNEISGRAAEFDVSKYLTKPYPPHELSTVIKNTLSSDKKIGQIVMPEE